MSALPTFIVVGAMKAGTTSLYHYLGSHEQIYMPKVKELDFFVEEMNWPRGIAWYEQQFTGAGESVVALGEASTAYTKYPRFQGVAERMATVVPAVRLVYVVRDPVERIRSHYEHRVALGAETAPAEVAAFENPIYLDYSRYALQVEQFLRHFPPEQLLVITSEGLRSDRRAVMHRVYEFLGVDPELIPAGLDTEYYRTDRRRSYPPVVWSARQLLKRRFPQAKRAKELVDSIRARRQPEPPAGASPTESRPDPLSPETRRRLEEVLAEDVARIRPYLGPGFDGWGIA